MALAFKALAFYLLLICIDSRKIKLCHPSNFTSGDFYCADRVDGWYNGGFFCSKNSRSCPCSCENADTSCQDKRCQDDWTQFNTPRIVKSYFTTGKGPNAVTTVRERVVEDVGCYYDDVVKGRIWGEPGYYDFCYRKVEKCDYAKCGHGESLIGCGRVSPGSCEKCSALSPGKYWASSGSCAETPCSLASGGEFVAKACTSTSDTVIASCAGYPGNKGYAVPNSRDTYYCPGGGLVLPLPENSEATSDYTSYMCLPGFYQNRASCSQCTPGFACIYGRKFECPAYYYSSAYGMSSCTMCTRQCSSTWQKPVRCAQGSTADPGCVSCSACDYDPKRGMSCVVEAYEMQGLPERCEPLNSQSSVAVCKQ